MEKQGIKETKEALLGAVALGAFVMERAKDGFKMDDVMAFATKLALDKEFSEKLKVAMDGADKVPAELSDLTFAEVIELAGIMPELLKIVSK